MRKLLPILALLLCCVPLHAQLTSGILDPSRVPYGGWVAGVPGGIPNRTTICTTIAPYGTSGSPQSASTITAAIGACSSAGGGVVLLGAGTFYLSDDISWGNQYSNVTLRGQGANSTFIVTYSGNVGCNGLWTSVDMCGPQFSGVYNPTNVCDWTANYSVGSTTIQLSNCGTTTPATGSISNLKIGSLIILDQLDEASDTGTIWNCATAESQTTPACSTIGAGGEQRYNGTCVISLCTRQMEQGVTVTSITNAGGGNYAIGISPGLYMPNWRMGQLPQAWFPNSVISGDGIEELSIDGTNSTSGQRITMSLCLGCWVKGVRSIDGDRDHVGMYYTAHDAVQDSYFFLNQSSGSVSYGVEFWSTWNSLVQNNIFQQVTDSDPSCTSACEGNVIGYNFDVNNTYASPDWFQAGFYQHASGDAYNLWEGNIGNGYNADDVHGTHHFETLFRNYLTGQQAAGCDGVQCTAQTVPVMLYVGSRYFNIIGNVLGQAGYHNNYQCAALSTTGCGFGSTSIYTLGYAGNGGYTAPPWTLVSGYCTSPACSATSYYDPQTTAYLYRWGNWDIYNGATQWNSSEVPSSISPYGNAVPASQTLPASFYYSGKPSWWPSTVAWPPIGPDVSSGNLGNVSGGTYDAYSTGAIGSSTSQNGGGTFTAHAMGGHVNENPAMYCALEVMGMPIDGTGSVLSFNASTCYSGASSTPQTIGSGTLGSGTAELRDLEDLLSLARGTQKGANQ